MEFRDAIKYLRGELGLTQIELASAIHVNPATVGRWESGKNLPSRSITAIIYELAYKNGASKECLEVLKESIDSAAKDRLAQVSDSLYSVEHASLREIVDEADFPLYVCDMQTDELLYINGKAEKMIGGGIEEMPSRKCYQCLMHRDTPCEFCHKNELTEDSFTCFETVRFFDGATYKLQGKRIRWNGHDAQVRYIVQTDAGDQLKSIIENMNGGVTAIIYDDDGGVRHAYRNKRYLGMFGYTAEQFARELKIPYAIVIPEDIDHVRSVMEHITATGQSVTFRYRARKRDGSILPVSCSSSLASIEGLGDRVVLSVMTDITEIQETEQRALVFGQRLSAIMDNINSGVVATILHKNGTVDYVFVTDRYYEILGFTREQYHNEVTDPYKLIYSEDIDKVRKLVSAMRGIDENRNIKYRAVRRDGKLIWLDVQLTIMSFADADEPVLLAVFTDVTSMAEAAEKIAAQRDEIEEMLNTTPSGIAVVEIDLKNPERIHTLYYNDRFFSFSGYSREEYEAILNENELSFVFEEDLPVLFADTKGICEGEIGASRSSTIRCHTKDGGYRWLLLTGQLAEKHGDACIVKISMVDVTSGKQFENKLRISEEMLRLAAEADRRSIVIFDVKANICYAESHNLYSAAYGESIGNIPQELYRRGMVAADSVAECDSLFARIRSGESRVTCSLQLRTGENTYQWFECNAAVVTDADARPDQAVLVFHNVTEQRVKEAVFKKWQNSINSRDPETYTLFRCNLSKDTNLDEREGKLLGIEFGGDKLTFNERTKAYSDEFVYPDDRSEYSALLNSDTLLAMFYRGEHAASLEYREIGEDGEPRWRLLTVETVEYLNSTDIQAFLLYEDIDEKKKTELQNKALRETDPLTGLLNRSAFAEKMERMIRREPKAQHALLMLDIDGLKLLNDTFGHTAGDQAIIDVASVIRAVGRESDLACRLGGDEFLVWLRDIPYDAVIGKKARQICDQVRKSFSRDVQLSASIGIAVYPRDGKDFDELYHSADQALYRVKQGGRNNYGFFSAGEGKALPDDFEMSDEQIVLKSSRGDAKRRMLIVDDDGISRAMLSHIFKDEYLIETAKNGTEAIMSLRHFGTAVSIVLLDLNMPGVSGYEVLRKIQANDDLRTIPVVVVSGNEDRETLLKVIESGAADFVTKPVDPDLIQIRARSAVSKAENERLRAQNSYLQLQREEELKFRTVLESTGTVVVEYDWRNHVFVYDNDIEKYIAGSFDHRPLWQVLLSDMVADSEDVRSLQDGIMKLANSRSQKSFTKLAMLKTPEGQKHWFRMNTYKQTDSFELAEKMIITFNDVHEEVLANEKLLFQATRDELTGLYNRAGFIEKATELIAEKPSGYYVMSCIDIEKFKVINDQYGTKKGDDILRQFAALLEGLHHDNSGICCRVMADNFAVLFPAHMLDTPELEASHHTVERLDGSIPPIKFSAGRCIVNDKELPVSAIYDRASIAKETVKGRYDAYIATYDESMRTAILRQQEITGQMKQALEGNQFEVWLQPQFNHATGMLSGAEALVRWRHPKEGIISPGEFIPIFEQNGFVYEVDKFVWEQTCKSLRKWLDQGMDPVPVSVNISRYDVFRDDLVNVVTELVKKYDIPYDLLRLEITESAFSKSAKQIIDVVRRFVELGFIVEIDDFGSGYSSLNTLKDVPAQVLKMDMRFLENDSNSQRGGSIIESVVRMAKWLGMLVIAEGVETIEQADYLKSIGCEHIQGYLYSKPIPISEYERLYLGGEVESKAELLRTMDAWNNNAFWNPKSMETLIFNSYIGGACIFEYHDGKTELLRYNDSYADIFRPFVDQAYLSGHGDMLTSLDEENSVLVKENIETAIRTKKESTFESQIVSKEGKTLYIRATMRQIAQTGERSLFYCVVSDISAQRTAERGEREAADRTATLMNNITSGVAASVVRDGQIHYLFANDRYYELLNYGKDDYTEKFSGAFFTIHPDDKERVSGVIAKATADLKPYTVEFRSICGDGSVRWMLCDINIITLPDVDEPVHLATVSDTTELHLAKEQEGIISERIRAVMDNATSGITAVIMHKDGTAEYLLVNDRYYELLGYTREQYAAEGFTGLELMHPDDLKQYKEQIVGLNSVGQQNSLEFRAKRRDGRWVWLRDEIAVISLTGVDAPVQLSCFTDITEIREGQQKEHALTVQLQTIMDNIRGGITLTRLHSNGKIDVVFANDGFYEMYGYTKVQMDAEVSDILDVLLPEDREQTVETVKRIVNEGKSETYEYRCRKRNGEVMWTQATNSVISFDGEGGTLLLAVATDITTIRAAQEEIRATADKLNTVMNSVENGISAAAVCGERVDFIFANDRFYEILGIEKGTLPKDVFSAYRELVHPDDREKWSQYVRSMRNVGQQIAMEYRMLRPNGKNMWVDVKISVVKLEGVDSPVQVSVFSDITARKQSEERLNFINELAGEILAAGDPELAIDDTLSRLLNYVDAERCYVVELDFQRGISNNTYEVCAKGVTSEKDNLQALPFSETDFWYATLMQRHYLVIEDAEALEDEALKSLLRVQSIRSIVLAPLWKDGRLIGFAGADNPKNMPEDIENFTAPADYIALTLSRRDIMRKIARSHDTIQTLMNDTPGGFVRMKVMDGGLTIPEYFNEGFQKLCGMNTDELMAAYGQDTMRGVHPDDYERVNAYRQRLIKDGKAESIRYRIVNGYGGYTWVNFNGRKVKDDNGETYLNIYYTDATEQMAEEEKQKELLDNLTGGIILFEFDGEHISVLHVNKSYWKLVDREPADYSAVDAADFVHPEDKPILMQEINSSIRQQREFACDFRAASGENGYTAFHVTAKVHKEKNGKYLLYATYTPISREIMSVQKMIPIAISTMMSASENISYVKDKDLRYVSASKSFAEMVGISDPQEMVGKTAFYLFDENYAAQYTADDDEIITTGESRIGMIETVPFVDGSIHAMKTSKYPIMDQSGGVIGVYNLSIDISEQKEKESQLELLTSAIPGGLAAYAITADGIETLYFNDGYFIDSGYTREEYQRLVKREPLALVMEEDRHIVREMLADIKADMRDGAQGNCTYRCMKKEGGYHWKKLKAVLSQTGENSYILNVVQLDISDRVEAEKRQSELLDSLPGGAALYEYDGERLTVIHINKRYWELVGREPSDHSTDSVMEAIHPDDRNAVFDEIASAIRQKRTAQVSVHILYGSSDYRPFRIRASIKDESNGKYLLSVSYTPISDVEMSLQDMLPVALSTMMSTSDDLSFVKDADGRYIACSKTVVDALGRESERDIIGKTSAEIFGADAVKNAEAEDKSIYDTGRPVIDRLIHLSMRNGTLATYSTSKYPLLDGRGRVVGIYTVCHDVTAEKAAKFELNTLLRVIPTGVIKYSADENMSFAYVNRNFVESLGYTEKQFKTKFNNSFREMIWKEDRARVETEIFAQESNDQISRFECRVEAADGQLHWFHDENVRMSDEGGREWYYATLVDVTAQKMSEESLRLAEEEYRIATRHSGHTIGRYDITAQTITITEDAATRLALPERIPDVPYGRVKLGKISEDTATAYIAFYENIMKGKKEGTVVFRKLLPGGWRWISMHSTTIFDEQGKPVSAIISYSDVTEQQEKELAYRKWQQSIKDRDPNTYTLFRANLNNTSVFDIWEGSLISVRLDDSMKTFNDRTVAFAAQCVYKDDRERYISFVNSDTMLAEYHRGHRTDTFEFRQQMPGGAIRWLKLSVDLVESPNSSDVEAYLLYESIDEQKKAEMEIRHQVETDPLTGLLNRKAFSEIAGELIKKSTPGTRHGFFMLDIDGFKSLNDSFGHAAGDEALVETAQKLRRLLRKDDLIGRLGGDEFVMFLRNIPLEMDVGNKADIICRQLIKEYDEKHQLTVSIGISIYPADGADVQTLYEKADTALYAAKENGKSTFRIYSVDMPKKGVGADRHVMDTDISD